jgi:hypothetical protein
VGWCLIAAMQRGALSRPLTGLLSIGTGGKLMYDELKERCRACSQGCIYPSECSYFEKPPLRCMRQLLSEAADAIENLSKPRWIPVSERKPKTDDIVIVAIHDDSGDTSYDVTNVGFYLDVFPLGIWVVENERCNYVTHWQPLPPAPKEDKP